MRGERGCIFFLPPPPGRGFPMKSESLTATVSPRGKVTLPKQVLRALRWSAGTRLLVENTPDGVLLKPAPVFAETRPEDVFGSLAYDGPAKTVDEMNAGVLAEARKQSRNREAPNTAMATNRWP